MPTPDYCHPCRGTGQGSTPDGPGCASCGGLGYAPEPPEPPADPKPARRGRPPLGARARRNGQKVQLSAPEWRLVDAARGDLSRQDWIVACAVEGQEEAEIPF